MFNWLRDKTAALFGAPRSGKWKTWRARHLLREPECQCCGTDRNLEVHHILPVHAGGPELAPPEGLITMCDKCHFVVGHACDWATWRPEVRRICRSIRMAEVRR